MAITSKKIKIESADNGMIFFYVTTKHSTCKFTDYGAQVLAFKVDGDELLWVSEKSYFEPPKAIRGGIPVCWPYFGAPKTAGDVAHGYARINQWDIAEISDIDNDKVKIVMTLDSKKLPDWCNFLMLSLEIVVGETLQMNLKTVNNGNKDFELSQALHTYFNVSNIADIEISGLEDTEYFDALANTTVRQNGVITFNSEVDRVYLDTDKTCTLIDRNRNYQVQIKKSGSQSTVVWNPWIDKSKRMADFEDDEYLSMVCIETVNAKRDSRILKSGESHTLHLEIAKK